MRFDRTIVVFKRVSSTLLTHKEHYLQVVQNSNQNPLLLQP